MSIKDLNEEEKVELLKRIKDKNMSQTIVETYEKILFSPQIKAEDIKIKNIKKPWERDPESLFPNSTFWQDEYREYALERKNIYDKNHKKQSEL